MIGVYMYVELDELMQDSSHLQRIVSASQQYIEFDPKINKSAQTKPCQSSVAIYLRS